MSNNKKILLVFGTRPEAIKMAPLVKQLCKQTNVEIKICLTAQHRSMLDQVMNLFELKADFDLDIMVQGQSLYDITTSVLQRIQPVLSEFKPDLVLVHGDTTTCLAVCIAAYYAKIDVGHVEAGLRTHDIYSPWPEEGNRKLVAGLAKYHFCPTERNVAALKNESLLANHIYLTGNTVIDALLDITERIKTNDYLAKKLCNKFDFIDFEKRLILMTCHRRENFGLPLQRICNAVNKIAEREDVEILLPVHLNPNISEVVHKQLGNKNNIHLVEPLEYLDFVYLMNQSYLILTDSGGVQEEAPSLNKPVLVLREVTERPEAVEAGVVELVGTDENRIVNAVNFLLDNEILYESLQNQNNPYGDGKASERIAAIVTSEDYCEFNNSEREISIE